MDVLEGEADLAELRLEGECVLVVLDELLGEGGLEVADLDVGEAALGEVAEVEAEVA